MNWKNIKDELPKSLDEYPYLSVLVSLENKAVTEAVFDTDRKEFFKIDLSCFQYNVTHWMPMPEPARTI